MLRRFVTMLVTGDQGLARAVALHQEDEEAYRTNKDGFRDKLDARLREILEADENKVASGLLAKVDRHEKPEERP